MIWIVDALNLRKEDETGTTENDNSLKKEEIIRRFAFCKNIAAIDTTSFVKRMLLKYLGNPMMKKVILLEYFHRMNDAGSNVESLLSDVKKVDKKEYTILVIRNMSDIMNRVRHDVLVDEAKTENGKEMDLGGLKDKRVFEAFRKKITDFAEDLMDASSGFKDVLLFNNESIQKFYPCARSCVEYNNYAEFYRDLKSGVKKDFYENYMPKKNVKRISIDDMHEIVTGMKIKDVGKGTMVSAWKVMKFMVKKRRSTGKFICPERKYLYGS